MIWRLSKTLGAALLSAALTAAGSRAQAPVSPQNAGVISPQEQEFRASLTPDAWARGADGMEKCTVAPATTQLAEQKWKTDSLEGVLSLPRDFHEVPATGTVDGNRWMGADSSTIEVHGNRALFRGGMAMGGMDIGRPLGLPTTCALTLEGRAAPSHTLMLTRPQHGDTLYVDTPNTVIRNGVGLQFILLTHSPAQQTALRAAVQSLKVSSSKSP
jgi:hypothetical protein